MKKMFCLLLILIFTASSLIAVRPAHSSTTKPSVPEFTVKFVDASYDVPTTSSIDPYNGQNIIHQGYHVEKRTIEVNIKNQPFNSYIANGQNISFYFNVREKGHFVENWTTIYNPDFIYPTQSKSDYTKVVYFLDENEYPFWDNLNQGGLVDFQVEALIGYTYVKHYSDDGQFIPFAPRIFEGETSGWSNTQTITITASSTPSPTPTPKPPKPSVPEFTVELADHSYDIPTTYSTDPYTGENVTHPGHHVDNKTIEVIIKNQHFSPYIDDDGHSVNLYYNISMKGHYENNWTYYPHNTYQVDYLQASSSDYTVISLNLTASFREGYFSLSGFPSDIPAGGEVDFQVQALIGYYTYSREPLYFMDTYYAEFTGSSSDWSETKTITIPAPAASSIVLLLTIIGVVIAVITVGTGLLIYFKKHKRNA